MILPVRQALYWEDGKFDLGAHLREQGQKPGVLRQGGEGRDMCPTFFIINEIIYNIIKALKRNEVMTRIILTRHGETLWNLEGRVQGAKDSPLTERGIHQARVLGQRLKSEGISTIISSDLSRAIATAQEIRKILELPEVLISSELREISFGEWEGQAWRELRQTDPERFVLWDQGPHQVKIPGGESMSSVTERSWNFLLSLPVKYPGQTLCLVTHGMTLQLLIKKALGLSLEDWTNVPWQYNTAVNILDLSNDGKVNPILIADHRHLEIVKINETEA